MFDVAPTTLAPFFEGKAPSALTLRQQERLRVVLHATLKLADRGGYDAVRMRDLASTGVALGTIYRFFGSRDFLVFRATSAWCERAALRSLPQGGSQDFRRKSRYQWHRLTAQFEAHPKVVEAWVRAAISDDPAVVAFRRAYPPWAFGAHISPPMDELDPDYAVRLRAMIETHAFGGLVRWVHGQRTLEELREDFADLLELVFTPPKYRDADPT
ncbi:helix-turn-helix domain-containing protein [Conexibacter stalactiti]|uniref:Helix-turn-helix domain-containing protein n=1 Tax=Conexibacter stalactiti TaxID=1940611 RepID=A0ABU4HIE2_9ACTN|nr:helix-turn-helix domain-containing protein [Conexibacter stalactiti]MDW5593037.1 helix-turn-helix domain-containing protein [Conexibacter stalactiti]MEC5033678.1 helix-turn-helix domain-containing protein [Conexibacter stalactiti]